MSVLTGEHAIYSQIITKRSSLFTQFTIDYSALLKAFNTNTLNFHKYLKNKLSSHQPSHMHNTRHRTNRYLNTPLFNHSKTQKRYLYQVVPIQNSLPNSLKNRTSEFTLKKQIKSHFLASQSQQCLNYQCQQFQIYYRCIYISLSSSPTYFRFFSARSATLPYGLDSNVTKPTCSPSHLYFIILPIVSCFNKIVRQTINCWYYAVPLFITVFFEDVLI